MKNKPSNYTFLVVENAPDVCEGIIRRMQIFENWISLGYCVGVKEAIAGIEKRKPQLIFLDWGLNGGSAYEVLQAVQNMAAYDPYIIFNTGFQKDNPEIPQEIINKYKVDKYLVKPLWENLRMYLASYVQEAEQKVQQQLPKPKWVWLEDEQNIRVQVALDKLICICQHPARPRSRILYLDGKPGELKVDLQWQKCISLLQQYQVDFFITKNRSHLVTRNYVDVFEKPFVRLHHFPAKIEVVKESLRDFEQWLLQPEY